jgi:hypothetical protein
MGELRPDSSKKSKTERHNRFFRRFAENNTKNNLSSLFLNYSGDWIISPKFKNDDCMDRHYIIFLCIILYLINSACTKNKYPPVLTPFDTICESMHSQLDSFMKKQGWDSMVVFRLKDYECSECKKYFINLYQFTRKKITNVVLLSQFSGYRSVSIFKNMTKIQDTIINFNNPIAEFDIISTPYIFLYKGQGKVTRFYVPIKDNLQDERMLKSFIE